MIEGQNFEKIKFPEKAEFEKVIDRQAEVVAQMKSDAGKVVGEASLRLSKAAIKDSEV